MRYSTRQVTRLGRAVLAGLLVGVGVGVVVHAAVKGPDAGGYVATDATVYSFIDVSGASGGASVLAGTDDGVVALTLPFAFTFYGQSYTTVCASTNGALYFVAAASACANVLDFAHTDVTSTTTVNDWAAVLPFWSDLTFDQSGAGAVFYQTLGTAGARTFVVQWQDAFPQGSQNAVTFQVVLAEGANTILYQYKTVGLGAGNAASNGAQATIGIRNTGAPGNNQQLQWSVDAPVLGDDSALLFSAGGDTTPPAVTATADPTELWRPKGPHYDVKVSGTITDAGSGVDPAGARYEVIDEDGQVQADGAIKVKRDGAYSLKVPLVEKKKKKGPRKIEDGIYTIVVSAKDLAGNVGTARAAVKVSDDKPKHDRDRPGSAPD